MNIQEALKSVGLIFNHQQGNIELAVEALMFDIILAAPVDKSLCRNIFLSVKSKSLADAYYSLCNSKQVSNARIEYDDYRMGKAISIPTLQKIAQDLRQEVLVKNFVHIFEYFIQQQIFKESK